MKNLEKLMMTVAAALMVLVAGCANPLGNEPSNDPPAASSSKALTAFGIVNPAATGTVNEEAGTIVVAVPHGTKVATLKATFTTTGVSVRVGDRPQTSGETENDFSAPVIYQVIAADQTSKNYTVSVKVAPSSAKSISAFGFALPPVAGSIDETRGAIAVVVPHGTDLTKLKATFATSGVSVRVANQPQTSGETENDFSAPVTYQVVAADASVKNYEVTVELRKGSLKIDLGAFPSGADAAIQVFGPSGWSRAVAGAETLEDLADGEYIVEVPQVIYTGLCYHPLRHSIKANVARGAETGVAVSYHAPSLTINLDAGNGSLAPMKFILIPAGVGTIGSNDAAVYPYCGPEHQVTFAEPFYLAETECTQAQYQAVAGSNPSENPGDNNPVENVAWDDLRAASTGFIDKLRALSSSYAYRLPSEAEWEYASRAGTSTPQYWGEADDGDYAWLYENSGGKSHPCRQKLPNAFGLYDMHGNVWEWCEDSWHDTHAGAPDDGEAWDGGMFATNHVFRGGNWNGTAWSVWERAGYIDRNGGGGFRLAFSLP